MSGLLRRLARQAVTPEAAAVHPLVTLPYHTPQDVDMAAAAAPQRRPAAPPTPSPIAQAEEPAAVAMPPLATTPSMAAATPTTGPTVSPGSGTGEPQPMSGPRPAAATRARITTVAEQPAAPHEPGAAPAAPVTTRNRPAAITAEERRPADTITVAEAATSAVDGPAPARGPQVRPTTAPPSSRATSLPEPPSPATTEPFWPDPLLAPTPYEAAHYGPATGSEPPRARPAATGPEPTEVHVHIGRIEVTAVTETTPAPRRSRPRREPMSLDDYLAQRQRGMA